MVKKINLRYSTMFEAIFLNKETSNIEFIAPNKLAYKIRISIYNSVLLKEKNCMCVRLSFHCT